MSVVPTGPTINTRMFSIDIRGIQEAMDANIKLIESLEPSGAMGRAVQFMTVAAHRYAVDITHVDTGGLKSSHRMNLDLGDVPRGEVFLDPGAVGPNGVPAYYGIFEHGRGGSHAFYDRVIDEAGERIIRMGQEILVGRWE
jgi:hypothetical protein